MLRIRDLKLPLDHGDDDLLRAAAARLGIGLDRVLSWRTARRSVDARRKDVRFSYVLDVRVEDEALLLGRLRDPKIVPAADETCRRPEPGKERLDEPPVVVGCGPAGLFAGLIMARMGYRPLILERGRPVEERLADVERFMNGGALDPESNIQFGEGGAGTFSDGKLYSLIHDPRTRVVFEEFAAAGAPGEILWSAKPHIGTDNLRPVVTNLRRAIEAAGGRVRFGARVDDLLLESGRVAAVRVNGVEEIPARVVVLALGHSARDTFEMLHRRGLPMVRKPFAVGLRVEHPQELIDRAQYGRFAGHPRLGPAEYKLVHHGRDGRSAYTFCVCPGGVVVAAASEEGGVVTNGMSLFARDGENANGALLVNVLPEDFGGDDPLAGVSFQRRWERAAFELGGGGHRAPVQLLSDFLAGRPSSRLGAVRPSYRPGYRLADLSACLPDFIRRTLAEAVPAFDRRLSGFALPEAVLTGVETRSSSPVRLERDRHQESPVAGLYPAGEGAGHAGGIVSSAVDGIRAAEAVIRRYAPG